LKITPELLQKQRRFLVLAKEPLIVEEFITQTVEASKGVPRSYYDVADLSSAYNAESLFSSEQCTVHVLQELSSEHVQELDALLKTPTSDILIVIQHGSIPNTKAYTNITTVCQVVKIDALDEHGAVSWVREHLRNLKIEYEDALPEFLVHRIGKDLYALRNEIRKLWYLSEGKKLDVDFCSNIVFDAGESRYFDLIENFFRRRTPATLKEFHKVSETAYVSLLHFMLGQVQRMHRLSIFVEQGHTPDEISDLLSVPKFVVKVKMQPILASYNKVKLLRLQDMLNDLDIKLRESKHNKRLLFEAYLLKALKI